MGLGLGLMPQRKGCLINIFSHFLSLCLVSLQLSMHSWWDRIGRKEKMQARETWMQYKGNKNHSVLIFLCLVYSLLPLLLTVRVCVCVCLCLQISQVSAPAWMPTPVSNQTSSAAIYIIWFTSQFLPDSSTCHSGNDSLAAQYRYLNQPPSSLHHPAICLRQAFCHHPHLSYSIYNESFNLQPMSVSIWIQLFTYNMNQIWSSVKLWVM